MLVGLGVFVTAIAAKSDDLKRASLAIFFGIALIPHITNDMHVQGQSCVVFWTSAAEGLSWLPRPFN